MKARIPLTRKERSRLEQEARAVCAKELEKQRDDLSRRLFKLMLYSLNEKFGFGEKRAKKALVAMTRLVEKSKDDEVFWEHVDRVVIDHLKIEFERDYTR